MADWNALRESVARSRTVTQSVLAWAAGIRERLTEADVPQEVIDDIDANTAELAAAVTQNTVAADEPKPKTVDMSSPRPSPGIEPEYPEGKPEGVE